MLEQIKELSQAANADYTVEYEESSMMNIRTDEYPSDANFVYIEEFRTGKYVFGKYGQKTRVMKMQIYFCKFTQMQNNAIQREALRDVITAEIVEPFMELYDKSEFQAVETWGVSYPLARFDANEVSVMLEFDCIIPKC
ncbi:hypothetical protein FACS189434_09340 [Bacteroidia bacterium]|nr:hypothetical protein FACS189434_09340 [Bacteroidia bacterium]